MLERPPSAAEAKADGKRRRRRRKKPTPEERDRQREQLDQRKRRYVHRQADGLVCLKVEAHEHDLAAALTRSGRLTPEQALERTETEKAVALLVTDFIARWGPGTRPLR